MLRIKGNISADSKGLGYRTVGKEITIQGQQSTQPVVEWLGASSETADNVLQLSNDPEARSARNISNWLREFLQHGEQPASEVFKAAESKFGNAGDRVRRASEQIGVMKRQENRRWYWSLPEPDKSYGYRSSRDFRECEPRLQNSIRGSVVKGHDCKEYTFGHTLACPSQMARLDVPCDFCRLTPLDIILDNLSD